MRADDAFVDTLNGAELTGFTASAGGCGRRGRAVLALRPSSWKGATELVTYNFGHDLFACICTRWHSRDMMIYRIVTCYKVTLIRCANLDILSKHRYNLEAKNQK